MNADNYTTPPAVSPPPLVADEEDVEMPSEPLFSYEPKEQQPSPGAFELLGQRWNIVGDFSPPPGLPNPEADPAAYQISVAAAMVVPDEQDDFRAALTAAITDRELVLEDLAAIMEAIQKTMTNREQRRVRKATGRPTGRR